MRKATTRVNGAMNDKEAGDKLASGAVAADRRQLDSMELLGRGNEVIISHGREEYRLRLTRQGKLILTK